MDKIELILASLIIVITGLVSYHSGYCTGRKEEHTTLMSVVSFMLQTLTNVDLEEMSDDFEDETDKDKF